MGKCQSGVYALTQVVDVFGQFVSHAAALSTTWHLAAWRNLLLLGGGAAQALDHRFYWIMHWVLTGAAFVFTAVDQFTYTRTQGCVLWYTWHRMRAYLRSVAALSSTFIAFHWMAYSTVNSLVEAEHWIAGTYSAAAILSVYYLFNPVGVALQIPITRVREHGRFSNYGESQDIAVRYFDPITYPKSRKAFARTIAAEASGVFLAAGASATVALMLYELIAVVAPSLEENREAAAIVHLSHFFLGMVAAIDLLIPAQPLKQYPTLFLEFFYHGVYCILFMSNLFYGTAALTRDTVISQEVSQQRFQVNIPYTIATLIFSIAHAVIRTRISYRNVIARRKHVLFLSKKKTEKGVELGMRQIGNPLSLVVVGRKQ